MKDSHGSNILVDRSDDFIRLFVLSWVTVFVSEAADCQDALPDCREYGHYACKGSYEAWARTNCAKFCGFCVGSSQGSAPAPTKAVCHDKLSDCAEYGKQACSGIYTSWAKNNCPDFCGLCPSLTSSCHDLLPDCDEYGKQACVGEYASWAKSNCAKFCGLCGSTTAPPNTGVRIAQPSSVQINYCIYKGQRYNQGDAWQDGCAYNCTCLKNGNGFYQCTDLCPRFLNLPPACSYQKVNGQCCPKLVCNDSAVPNSGQAGVCRYTDGKTYKTGDTWVEGCLYNCTCVDDKRGYYRCRDICPTYTQIPKECSLIKKPNKCCPEVECNYNNTGNTVLTNATLGGNTTIKCPYKGKLYNEGETWEDGCDYTCTCQNKQGFYTCTSKCISWNLPTKCTLQAPAPGKCCKTPKCPPGFIINYPPGYKEV